MTGITAFILPAEVNTVGICGRRGEPGHLRPGVSYGQAWDHVPRGGCHTVTEGYLSKSGADVTAGAARCRSAGRSVSTIRLGPTGTCCLSGWISAGRRSCTHRVREGEASAPFVALGWRTIPEWESSRRAVPPMRERMSRRSLTEAEGIGIAVLSGPQSRQVMEVAVAGVLAERLHDAPRVVMGPRSGHADRRPPTPPAAFRKLDAIAVLTGPLLPVTPWS